MSQIGIAEGERQLRLLRADPAAAAYWAWIARPWRIELAFSLEAAPLYLTLDGTRVVWVPDASAAERFGSHGQARAFAADELRLPVRITQ